MPLCVSGPFSVVKPPVLAPCAAMACPSALTPALGASRTPAPVAGLAALLASDRGGCPRSLHKGSVAGSSLDGGSDAMVCSGGAAKLTLVPSARANNAAPLAARISCTLLILIILSQSDAVDARAAIVVARRARARAPRWPWHFAAARRLAHDLSHSGA